MTQTGLNRLGEAILTSTNYLCFEQKYEQYQSFIYLKIFSFLEMKFSIYLNRRVFVMKIFRKYHSHEAQPSRCTKSRRDEEKTMTK